MAYPATLDDLNAGIGASGNPLSSPNHITQHTNEVAVIEALETKVGIDNSAVTTTIDYKLKNSASVNPGHKHSLLAGISDVAIVTPVTGNGLIYNQVTSKWENGAVPTPDASTTVKGLSKINPAPASATEPIALGANFATTSTGALDNTSNKIVDQADVAENTNSKIVRRKSDGNITVPTTPTASTDGASMAYVQSNPITSTNGTTTRAYNGGAGDTTIAHGLGRIPKKVKITAIWVGTFNVKAEAMSFGVYNGTTTSCVYNIARITTGNQGGSIADATYIIYIKEDSGAYQRATVAVDATNITLTWTKSDLSNSGLTIAILWEAI